MGEVYRAHDEKLNRDGTIKVLSAALSQDAGRLRRGTGNRTCWHGRASRMGRFR